MPKIGSFQTTTKLELSDGKVIDASQLSAEDKLACIEFAIHLIAPNLAKILTGNFDNPQTQPKEPNKDDYNLPEVMKVPEVAQFLRTSNWAVYDMCRRYGGKFFPHVTVGNRILIHRSKLIEWIEAGGTKRYKEQIQKEKETLKNDGILRW